MGAAPVVLFVVLLPEFRVGVWNDVWNELARSGAGLCGVSLF